MTDDGVQALAMKLPLLHFIGLQATGITDASVDALMKGASANILRTVYIRDCADVTLEGAARMRAALPQCVVLT